MSRVFIWLALLIVPGLRPASAQVPGPKARRPHAASGSHDFGPQALIDLEGAYLRRFDYWLKGVDNGILREPRVTVFAMGSNRWLQAARYPLPETRMEKPYLSIGGHANTFHGDGRLTFTAPADREPPDRYVYDPGDPTPDPSLYAPSEADEPAHRRPEDLRRSSFPPRRPSTMTPSIAPVSCCPESPRNRRI